MLVVPYRTKAELEQSIGQPLRYETGNVLMADYRPYGTLAVEGRPQGSAPRWWAEVTLVGGRITRVE